LSTNAKEAIELFLKRRGTSTVTQISRNLILSRGKVHRLLLELVQEGKAEKTENGPIEKFTAKSKLWG
jgi:DNA-binding IclR family transcriptional regulator